MESLNDADVLRAEHELAVVKHQSQSEEDSPKKRNSACKPGRPMMKMTQAAYTDVMSHLDVEEFEVEQGGMLIVPDDAPDVVVQYVPDTGAEARHSSLTLDHDGLNKTIRRLRSTGLSCGGLVHLHPPGICRPSGGDVHYLRSLFTHDGNDADYVLFPIVCNGRLYPWIISGGNSISIHVADLVLV